MIQPPETVEHPDFHSVYGADAQYRAQRRAVAAEMHRLLDIVCADQQAYDLVDEALIENNDTCVGVELNVGDFSTVGVEVYSGNSHAETEMGFSIGPQSTRERKQQRVEEMIERYREAVGDDGAVLFAFTARKKSMHIGFSTFDRPNEAVLNMAGETTLLQRLLGGS